MVCQIQCLLFCVCTCNKHKKVSFAKVVCLNLHLIEIVFGQRSVNLESCSQIRFHVGESKPLATVYPSTKNKDVLW